MSDPQDIDRYVHELCRTLRRDFRDEPEVLERIAAEAEDHLLEERDRLIALGCGPTDAERAAIAQFGSVRLVSHRFRRELGIALSPLGSLASLTLYATSLIAMLVTAAGLIIIAETAFSYATGFPNPTGVEEVTYTNGNCNGFISIPRGKMEIDSSEECARTQTEIRSGLTSMFQQVLLIGGAIVAAVGGVAVALTHISLRWVQHNRTDRSVIGNGYRVIGATVFGLLTLFFTLGQVDSTSTSFGFYALWPAALVTLAVTVGYARSLRRALA